MNGGPNSNRWTVLLVQLSSSKRGLLIAFIISPDKNCFAKHVLIKDEQTQMDSCFNFFSFLYDWPTQRGSGVYPNYLSEKKCLRLS